MYTAEAENALLAGSPDFVVDAIDNIDTKVGQCCLSEAHSCGARQRVQALSRTFPAPGVGAAAGSCGVNGGMLSQLPAPGHGETRSVPWLAQHQQTPDPRRRSPASRGPED